MRPTNKDKIIEAAYESFRFYGYNGTSIDMLIKAAGVSKSNFYYHFESKEELGLKILGIHVDYQKKIVSEFLLNRDIDPLERFIRFYTEGIYAKRDLFLRTGSFIARMDLEQGSINQKFRSVIDEFFQVTNHGVEVSLEDCEKAGMVQDGVDTKLIPQFLIYQFKGAMVMAKVFNSYSPLERSYEKTWDFLLKKELRHLIPRHDELPVRTFSYHDQLKPLLSP
ncbi:MAG: TetR/AcrR family transcriptional regulator [Candidatus Dadabacteria bacterium]|nr:TetR/AcrR family transcriptional regulator [Candidatus Dadabacteria bacterium]